jgi:hypothetical protein
MVTRRNLIRQSFCFSAVFLASRKLYAAESTVTTAPQATHALMIGDWGWNEDSGPQKSVAKGMVRYMADKKIRPQCLFLLGDNFYGPFKGGVKCPRWKEQFSDIYQKKDFPFPCNALLGNHDYDDEPVTKLAAELAYAKANPGTRWNMPAKWYRIELGPAAKPLVTVLMLDSNYHNTTVSLTEEERDAQMVWFKAELEKPRTTPWLVVMGHHPLYSNGTHGDDPALIADWDELLKKHKVHFYFCGHDHDLQHIEFEEHPTSFVISGAGGATIREPKLEKGPFAVAVYGFTHLEITVNKFIVRHLDFSGKLLHEFSKNPDGTWETE